jgi:hypothetical protein
MVALMLGASADARKKSCTMPTPLLHEPRGCGRPIDAGVEITLLDL